MPKRTNQETEHDHEGKPAPDRRQESGNQKAEKNPLRPEQNHQQTGRNASEEGKIAYSTYRREKRKGGVGEDFGRNEQGPERHFRGVEKPRGRLHEPVEQFGGVRPGTPDPQPP